MRIHPVQIIHRQIVGIIHFRDCGVLVACFCRWVFLFDLEAIDINSQVGRGDAHELENDILSGGWRDGADIDRLFDDGIALGFEDLSDRLSAEDECMRLAEGVVDSRWIHDHSECAGDVACAVACIVGWFNCAK